jgi:hypothetical protein
VVEEDFIRTLVFLGSFKYLGDFKDFFIPTFVISTP